MKKNIFSVILFFIGISCLVSCTKKTKDEALKQNSKATSIPTKEYKDDTIFCSYNDSILKYQKSSSPDDDLLYSLLISDDPVKLKNDLKNNSFLNVSTISHSIAYDDSKTWMLPSLTKTFFNGTFGLEDNDSIKVIESKDHTYEYTNQTNGAEYYGCVYDMNNSNMTVSICQILPNEKQEYKDALKSCYKSIKYIKSDNPTEKADKNTDETTQSHGRITSGNLYNAIKKIDNNACDILKIDEDSYSLFIISDSPKTFFKNSESIYKKVFKKKKNVIFEMKTKNNKNIVSLNIVHKEYFGSPIYSSLIIWDKKWQKKVQNVYNKNKFWQSIDSNNLYDKEFQKIIDKYSK
jgi:hypothetical protein